MVLGSLSTALHEAGRLEDAITACQESLASFLGNPATGTAKAWL